MILELGQLNIAIKWLLWISFLLQGFLEV